MALKKLILWRKEIDKQLVNILAALGDRERQAKDTEEWIGALRREMDNTHKRIEMHANGINVQRNLHNDQANVNATGDKRFETIEAAITEIDEAMEAMGETTVIKKRSTFLAALRKLADVHGVNIDSSKTVFFGEQGARHVIEISEPS